MSETILVIILKMVHQPRFRMFRGHAIVTTIGLKVIYELCPKFFSMCFYSFPKPWNIRSDFKCMIAVMTRGTGSKRWPHPEPFTIHARMVKYCLRALLESISVV